MTLVGSEHPRIWTPPLRELTPETSLGFEVIDFAEQVLQVNLYPWQKWLFIHALELHPDCVVSDPDPLFRFDTIIVIVGRQNGKTEAIKVKKLWRIYVDGAKTAIATAQDLSNSEKAWAEAVVLAQSTPDLDAEIAKVELTHGQKSLVLNTGNQYRVATTSRRGGRGFSADDLDLDELREHLSWEPWSAVVPTTLAKPRSQVWCWSNAGDALSVVLWHLRAQAMAAAEGVEPGELEAFAEVVTTNDDDPADVGESPALFEWSAPPKAGKWDRSGWALSNPALGHGFLTERKLAGMIRTFPEWKAKNEILCQWRSTGSGGPFPDGAWSEGSDPDAEAALDLSAQVAICVDMSADRSMAYVGMATYRKDGNVHLQILAQRAGSEWIIPWLESPDRKSRDRWVGVTWQLSGAPVSSLTDDLRNSETLKDLLVDWTGSDIPRSFGVLYDLVRPPRPHPDDPAREHPEDIGKRRAFHLPQPVLDLPASSAVTKPLGDGLAINRTKSPGDAAPLVAVQGAAWLLLRPEKKPKKIPQVHDWPDDLE